jgi:hypothetical protein
MWLVMHHESRQHTLYGSHVVSGFALGSTPDGVTVTIQLKTASSGPTKQESKQEQGAVGENIACEGAAIFEDDHCNKGDVIK